MNFTKRKFLKLEPSQRHKKCAELLRIFYEKQTIDPNLLQSYQQLAHWLDMKALELFDNKSLSNRYHHHLQLAKCSLKEHNLLPDLRTQDRAAKQDFSKHVNIYLDNIRSAYNVGSIIRTTEALRLGRVYFSENTPFTDNPKVIKTSMGVSDIVPCFIASDISSLPRPLIGLDTSDKAVSLFDFTFPKTFTLILGNEEYGISKDLLQELDYILEIPMMGCKNSINVACAFAIAAAEIKKQER